MSDSLFLGCRKRAKISFDQTSMSSSSSSRLSAHSIHLTAESLLVNQNRRSTSKTYQSIRRQFNRFLVSLDILPKLWEDRATLYIAYLIKQGVQSATVKTYLSAIKRNLIDDKYKWDDSKVLITSLTRACKLNNDTVYTRLPIQCGFLELILFELERIFNDQWYLQLLYQAIYLLGYYGMMRVGELTEGVHVVKACNVHLGVNKNKLLVVLYTSKTHGEADGPQKIKITSNVDEKSGAYRKRHFCPFKMLRAYIALHGDYTDINDRFFVFRDGTSVKPDQAKTGVTQGDS